MKRPLLVFVVLVLLAAVAGAGYVATHPAARVAPVTVTSADAVSAGQKAASLQAAVEQARRTGKPVPVRVTFTDAELTALANQQLSGAGQPLDSAVLHSSSAGYVEGTANGHLLGQSIPVYFRALLLVAGGRPELEVTSVQVSAIGVPSALVDQLKSSLAGPIDLPSDARVQDPQVAYADGSVTLTGTVLPA